MAQGDVITYNEGHVDKRVVHNAITADVTSGNAKSHPCAGAKGIAIVLTEAGTVNNRQVDMTVEVTIDGSTFVAYNMLINNETNDAGDGGTGVEIGKTRIATLNRAVAGSDILWFDPDTLGPITRFKVIMDVTDASTPTGNFAVTAVIQY